MRAWLAPIVLAAGGMCGGCASGPSTQASDKVALVIGNAAYSVVTPLKNPVHDEQDVCAAFKRIGFKTLCFNDVRTREDFSAHVEAFVRELGPSSAAVFYYSGHGVQSRGENYLVPVDAGLTGLAEDPLPQLYPLNDLFGRLRQQPSAFQMIVLDACRSDPFASAPVAEGGGASETGSSRAAAFMKSLEVVGKAGYGTAVVNDAPVGTIVLYATASKDTAYDGEGRNGPLTKHFLLNVEKRGLNIEDLMKNVISGVQDETKRLFGKEQTPFSYQSFRRRFCFAGCFNPDNFQVPPTN